MTFDFHIMGGTLAEHPRGRVLVHDRVGAVAVLPRARWRARSTAAGRMWLPAVLLALTVTSHLVVAIFAVLAGIVIWLIRHPVAQLHARRRRSARWASCSPRSGSLPLAVNLGNTTDMRYEPDRQLPRLDVPVRELVPLPARRGRARRRDLVPPSRHARPRRDHGDDGPASSTTGRGCATSWARRRPGTCGCCRSGTSCSSCSRRWASRSWRGSSALGVAWVVTGSDRATRRIPTLARGRRHPSPDDELVRIGPGLARAASSVVACRATPCG